MKYIDAEKLKISLSDLAEHHKYYNGDFHDGVVFAVDEIMEEITSLQQEQPEVDLEKEVTHFVNDDKILSKFVKYDDALLIARHFYKLGKKAREEGSK